MISSATSSVYYHLCHPLSEMNLLVMEGPAGSGKTTLIHRLLSIIHTPFVFPGHVVDFPRPRSYDGTANLALSIIKDNSSFLSAVAYEMTHEKMPEETRVTIIDRLMLSQMVYGRIRQGVDPLMMEDELLTSLSVELTFELQMMRNSYALMLSRDGHYQDQQADLTGALQLFPTPRLNVMFAVLLPEISLLETIRQQADRVYPYSAAKEVMMYQSLVDGLTTTIRSLSLPNLSLTIRTFRYSNLMERDDLPLVVAKRYLHFIK